MAQHEKRDHAYLSASGSHRWLHCTPSVMLEELHGIEGDKTFAEEGTKAHELAELYIKRDILGETIADSDLDKIKSSEYYSAEMESAVKWYVEIIGECFREAQTADKCAQLITEQRVDLRDWVPESFGTTDCTIIANDEMLVIDLKYGKGVRVDAENNPQLRLYALGSYKEHNIVYDIKTVKTMIIQPRIDHVSTETISIDDLLVWAENEVRPNAEKAFSGVGDLVTGDWCQFCKVRTRCRKLYEENIEKAKICFGEDPNIMSDDEIAEVVIKGEKITSWITAVQEMAEREAIAGKKFKGLKLVRGRSVRKWVNDEKARQAILERFPGLTESQITKVKLCGIGDLEKLLGKKVFADNLSDLTIKPDGALKLVGESDARPEASKTDLAKDAFSD